MSALLPQHAIDRSQHVGSQRLSSAAAALASLPPVALRGQVKEVSGLLLRIEGLAPWLQIGSRITLAGSRGPIPAEVVSFGATLAEAMAFGPLEGVGPRCGALGAGLGGGRGAGGGPLLVAAALLQGGLGDRGRRHRV